MVRHRTTVTLGLGVLGVALLAPSAVSSALVPAGDTAAANHVQQAGTYVALDGGDLTGPVRAHALVGPGSIGLGTFNGLDGEAVVVDGRLYRVTTAGTPVPVPRSVRTPFLQTVRFQPQATARVPRGTACADLGVLVDRLARTTRGVVAVRVEGRFSDLVTRSVPRQPDGTPLVQALTEQVVFPLGARRATLVGFRSGPDVAGLTPTGVHLHGITANGARGGHVLSCVVSHATLSVQRTAGVLVQTG
ncbi:MAG: acetolactate decarboxylase [Candidatus Nanopelagicales bacterium]